MQFLFTTGDNALDREIEKDQARITKLEAQIAALTTQINTPPAAPPQSFTGPFVRTLSKTFQVAGDVSLTQSGVLVITQSGQNFDFNVPSGGTPTFHGARVYNSGNISLTNSTETALTFDTERYDTDAYHSTSSNTSRLTAPTTGYYRITGYVEWDAGIGVTMTSTVLSIRINGATFIASQDGDVGLRFVRQMISAEYLMAAGDYAEITVNGAVAVGTPSIINAGNISPEASISLIGT